MSRRQPKMTTKSKGTKIEITPMESDVPLNLKEFEESMEVPSTAQLESTLSKAEESIESRKGGLGSQGKVLASDAQSLFRDTRTLIHDKNRGEKLQRLFREGKESLFQSARYEGISDSEKKKLEEEAEQLGMEMKQLYGYLQNLTWNFLRSNDFRDLAADWIQFLQSLGTEKIKKQAAQKEGKGAEAIQKGLKEVPKPASEEELQAQTEDRLSDLLSRLSNHPQYKDTINEFFALADRLQRDLLEVTENPPMDTLHFRRMIREAADILSEFSGQKELDDLRSTLYDTYQRIQRDERLNRWFGDLRALLVEIAENPEQATTESRKKDIKDIVHRGRNILSTQKWRKQMDFLYDRFNVVIDNVKSDQTLQSISHDLSKFAHDFAFNKEGVPDIYVIEESISQMKSMLIPLFREQLANLPFKKIEISNETYHIRLEDMLIEGPGFFPDRLDVLVKNYHHIDFTDNRRDKMHHELVLQVDHIRPRFKEVKFYYKRKSFPSIEDQGVADMGLTGEGATIQVVWKIHKEGTNPPRAVLHKVVCDIDELSIKIAQEQTRHEIIDTILAPIVSGILKRRLARYVEEYLQEKLESFNEQVNSFFESRPTERLEKQADTTLKQMYTQATQSVSSSKASVSS